MHAEIQSRSAKEALCDQRRGWMPGPSGTQTLIVVAFAVVEIGLGVIASRAIWEKAGDLTPLSTIASFIGI